MHFAVLSRHQSTTGLGLISVAFPNAVWYHFAGNLSALAHRWSMALCRRLSPSLRQSGDSILGLTRCSKNAATTRLFSRLREYDESQVSRSECAIMSSLATILNLLSPILAKICISLSLHLLLTLIIGRRGFFTRRPTSAMNARAAAARLFALLAGQFKCKCDHLRPVCVQG